MYDIKIASIDEFRNSRNRWNELAMAMNRPSVFCTWEWIYTWWKHYGDDYEPLIIFIFKNSYLHGILPLALRKMIIEDSVIPGRILSFCGSNELHSDHLDIICDERNATSYFNSIIAFLSSEYRKWDVLHLSHIPEDANIFNSLKTSNYKFQSTFRKVSAAPYISLPKNFEEYEKNLSKNKRNDLKRQRKILYQKSGILYESFDPDKNQNGINELFFLHNLRAEKKKIKTSFAGDKLIKFHQEIMNLFYEKRWIRLRFLRDGEKAIAANYCFEFGNRLFYYQSGIDPSWSSRSVGNILVYELIKEACENKVIEFDFLRGGEEYKNIWTKDLRTLYNINVYNRSLMGSIIRVAYNTRYFIKNLLLNKLILNKNVSIKYC